jgi:hypothetical protein
LPRDLADVLHYFLPELDAGPTDAVTDEGSAPTPPTASASPEDRTEPLWLLGLPVGDCDVVKAALAWNLAVETARLGRAAIVLAPETEPGSPVWPEAGPGPLGTELVLSPARDLDALIDDACQVAKTRGGSARHGGGVFVCVPPHWLDAGGDAVRRLDWWLLLTSSHRRELQHACAVAKTLASANPLARIGLTVHGVRSIAEARSAFEHAARVGRDQWGITLHSYGLLVDDLHVYRAIAAQRAIGIAHPQAAAAKALMDVARLLDEDARSGPHG